MKQFKLNDDVPGMRECRKTQNARAIQIMEEFEVYSMEGIMHGKAGDYLMKGVEGENYVCDKEIFESSYIFVNNSIVYKIFRTLLITIGCACVLGLGIYGLFFLFRLVLGLLNVDIGTYEEPIFISRAVSFATTYLACCFVLLDWKKLVGKV